MRQLSIRTKLLGSVAIMAILLLGLALLSLAALRHDHDEFTHYVEAPSSRTNLARDILTAADSRAASLSALVRMESITDIDIEANWAKSSNAKLAQMLAQLKKSVYEDRSSTLQEHELVAVLEDEEADYQPVLTKITEDVSKGTQGKDVDFMRDIGGARAADVHHAANAFIALTLQQARVDVETAKRSFEHGYMTIERFCVFSLLVFGVLALVIERMYVERLAKALQMAEQMQGVLASLEMLGGEDGTFSPLKPASS